jgi:hypothetical protein
MEKIENLNGQQEVIDAVLGKYNFGGKELLVASGTPGVGVSWALQRAAEGWEAAGGIALHATGEPLAIDRKLFPWLTLILPGSKRLARLTLLKGGVTQGSRAIPMVGSLTSFIVDEVLNYRKKRLAREAVLIGEQEQDLLFVIQNTAGRKRLLLTIDKLDVWDEPSWNLLRLILSSRLDELYPALKDVLLLVASPKALSPRLSSLGVDLPTTEFLIRPLERAQLPTALATFDLKINNRDDMDRLYEMTDCRLDLLHDLAVHFRDMHLEGVEGGLDIFYTRMMERRIHGIGDQTHALEELLAAAAVLGQTFTFDDIQCLTGYPVERLDANLQFALSEHFVSIIGQTARFQSNSLHQYFHREYSSDHVRYHGIFAECLRAMRPGEYAYRLRHLILAERPEDALTCYALAVLASFRARDAAPEPGPLKEVSGWREVSEYLVTMKTAHELYVTRQLLRGIEALDTVEGFLPEVLSAERDCLESQILLESHRVVDFRRAETLLGRWEHLKSVEGELWARIAHVLIVAHVQTCETEKARALEKALTAEYWNKRRLDPWALYGLNVLRRRAECIHQLPTATLRLESAVSFFGPRDAGTLPRHPRDYYYSLNNLVGNLLANGRFTDAYDRAVELEELVRDHPHLGWLVLEIPANNCILASYLSGQLSPSTAIEMMEKVLEQQNGTGDHVLMENNHAVYLAHVGRESEAFEMLSRIYSRINSDGQPDSYHRYFVGDNLAGLMAVAGKTSEAIALHAECSRLLDDFYPAIHETMRRRHELIGPVLGDAQALGISGFDAFLAKNYKSQLGPQWAFYGRGFLLTDIQFWAQD